MQRHIWNVNANANASVRGSCICCWFLCRFRMRTTQLHIARLLCVRNRRRIGAQTEHLSQLRDGVASWMSSERKFRICYLHGCRQRGPTMGTHIFIYINALRQRQWPIIRMVSLFPRILRASKQEHKTKLENKIVNWNFISCIRLW